MPDGLPDSFGLWGGTTQWCELKVGKPSQSLLRPNQREFGYACIRRGVPIYTCVGYRGTPLFFKDFAFGQPIVPPWYHSP